MEELRKAIVGDPRIPYAHFDLGEAYLRLGKVDLASREYSRTSGQAGLYYLRDSTLCTAWASVWIA